MTKEPSFIQTNLFGTPIISIVPKKIKSILSEEERAKRKEKSEAHIAWKLLKSRKFTENLSDKQKSLLQKYYRIKL